jgi:hypothetical protein
MEERLRLPTRTPADDPEAACAGADDLVHHEARRQRVRIGEARERRRLVARDHRRADAVRRREQVSPAKAAWSTSASVLASYEATTRSVARGVAGEHVEPPRGGVEHHRRLERVLPRAREIGVDGLDP